MFGPITVAATSGVHWSQTGLASGLVNTSQQLGGSLRLAILTGVSTSVATSFDAGAGTNGRAAALAAQIHGYQTAFHISAAFLVVAALVAAFVLKQKGQESVAEAGATVGMAEG